MRSSDDVSHPVEHQIGDPPPSHPGGTPRGILDLARANSGTGGHCTRAARTAAVHAHTRARFRRVRPGLARHDYRLGQTVALKSALIRDPETEERTRREAKALAAVRHPNCVQIFDLVDANSDPGLAELGGLVIVNAPIARPVSRSHSPTSTANPNPSAVYTPRRHPSRVTTCVYRRCGHSGDRLVELVPTPTAATMAGEHFRSHIVNDQLCGSTLLTQLITARTPHPAPRSSQ